MLLFHNSYVDKSKIDLKALRILTVLSRGFDEIFSSPWIKKKEKK